MHKTAKLLFLSIPMMLMALCGCSAPSGRLSFPEKPIATEPGKIWYDVAGTGKADFGLSLDREGQIQSLLYCDVPGGNVSREYRLSDYDNADVPNVILLLDSIPYHSAVEKYQAGEFRFCPPPSKIIPPFPSLTEVCYSAVLHCPPLPGMIDQSYDPKTREVRHNFWSRVMGEVEPWEARCDYHASFYQDGLSFLHPKPWYAAELELARAEVDSSPNRTTVVYLGSAASMVCKYGKAGADEVMDEANRWCLQLLYERHGAVKITIMADHGHNFKRSTNLPIDQYVTSAGFHVSNTLAGENDVFLEVNGLVTYAAIDTMRPKAVADALVKHPEIELAMYLDGDRVIVADAGGSAAIERKGGKFRYVPLSCDPLEYEGLNHPPETDADGFATEADWFAATADEKYPDGPRRLWDAFHANAIDPPRVMFTTLDGYCAGLRDYEKYITMESTHGGLNQINSATFLFSMTGRAKQTMHSNEILGVIAPGFEPIPRTQK